MTRVRDVTKMREYGRQWRLRHPMAWRAKYIKKAFGISEDEFEERLRLQKNLCGLCGEKMMPLGRLSYLSPVLDHDHASDKLRDFIHRRCNIGLGLFLDDPNRLLAAIDYLKRHAV